MAGTKFGVWWQVHVMVNLRTVLDYLWRWKREPVADPSPVDAIVRLLRETNKAERVHGRPHQTSRD